MNSNKLRWALLTAFLLVAIRLLWPEKPASDTRKTEATSADSLARQRSPARPHRISRPSVRDDAPAQVPQGIFEYLFDQAPNGRGFLLGKGRDSKFRPHSDAPSGMDLWLQDSSGNDRLVHDSVYRAKFSPDGSKIAFTTSDCVLHVQDLQGNPLAEVVGVYAPNWKPDGSAVIFAQVGEGQDAHRPGTRQLTALNLATGAMETLTDGKFDDGRPEFNPLDDSILFVSGARSGLASFWKVPATGGEPVQLTNRSLQQVNELFVPTPYDKTIWSGDKRWFLYDFKSGDQQETWGLEFAPDGTMKQATKLAEGINPRWQVDGTIQTIVGNLP